MSISTIHSEDVAASLRRVMTTGLFAAGLPSSPERPCDWVKPAYATLDYREAELFGWVTEAEAKSDRAAYLERRERAIRSKGNVAQDPLASRPAPPESRQYAGAMATRPFRDEQLTGNAKALLAILRAFCGKGTVCHTSKPVLADLVGRSIQSVKRYLFLLMDRGYIRVATRTGLRGMHIGLTIRLVGERVLPFFAQKGLLAAWLAQTANSPRNRGGTEMSPINDSSKESSLFRLNTVENMANFFT